MKGPRAKNNSHVLAPYIVPSQIARPASIHDRRQDVGTKQNTARTNVPTSCKALFGLYDQGSQYIGKLSQTYVCDALILDAMHGVLFGE